jgi:hypothetical protein
MNDNGKITLTNSVTQPSSTPRFKLGQLVATPGALVAFQQNGQMPATFVVRHQLGDWGLVDHHDQQANDRAIRDGSRILSAYKLDDGTRIWIITEAADEQGNRESTCILLPSEY